MVTLPGTGKNWIRYFQYEEKRDTPTDTRNIILIVFALVAAVTFQAAVNPPGGVWQQNEGDKKAGEAIYALDKKAYYVFLIFNTLAFSNSIFIILSLTYKFPFHLEIWAASVSMCVSYGSAIFAVSPKAAIRLRYVLIAAAGPFALRFLVLMFNLFLRKRFVKDTQPPPDFVQN
ncbi:uncharacterized protein LOC114186018 [Vigna unguiculata]|uniref:PGG domain-containing protein n=1 Tax=Vigna unguiculata TaxID=3917 RepID=A0A4D6NIL6_VIGUN|nr:uncharacterized protein LOC114186018 [Vigna unguiculata]QCE12429.1 hypothetical protein DEO72_LG10g3673 [Vigna unguiculata]